MGLSVLQLPIAQRDFRFTHAPLLCCCCACTCTCTCAVASSIIAALRCHGLGQAQLAKDSVQLGFAGKQTAPCIVSLVLSVREVDGHLCHLGAGQTT